MKFGAKITGQKKLMRQLKDLPDASHEALKKSMISTAKTGARKARAIVPVDTGELKQGINWNYHESGKGLFAFVNFHDGTKEDAIKVGAINYGRKTGRVGTGSRLKGTVAQTGVTGGYHFIETVKMLIAARHMRAVRRNLNKAFKEVVG